jgi:hypothetical protein
MKAAAALLLMLGAAAPAAACALTASDGSVLRQGQLQLAWRTEPAKVVQGEPFVLWLRLCPADAEVLKVDATMPEHRHGMNYKPTLRALGEGRVRVEGLLWHMSGRWEWRFEVRAGAGAAAEVLRTSVVLP